MEDYYILVGSITSALKSKNILNRNNIKAYIIKISKYKDSYGCGYSIYAPNKTRRAIKLLIESGIKIIGRLRKEDE
jgi:hypothetical protein